jgi:hypothetical protein
MKARFALNVFDALSVPTLLVDRPTAMEPRTVPYSVWLRASAVI